MTSGEFMPFYLRLEGFSVAVLGGGSVGVRKARYYARAGAEVSIYALRLSGASREEVLNEGIVFHETNLADDGVVREIIDSHDIIVIALSDRRLAEKISREATRRGKLVNNAVEVGHGNMIVPFHRRVWGGGIGIAVTSYGESGITARRLLDRLSDFAETLVELREMHRLLSFVKRAAKECIEDAGRRIALYFYLADHPRRDDHLARGISALVETLNEVLGDVELECFKRALGKEPLIKAGGTGQQ